MFRWLAGPALAISLTVGTSMPGAAQDVETFAKQDGDFIIRDFKFRSGETLPELRLHYTTLGKPIPDAEGHIANAVLILHGTGAAGDQFLRPQFADVLYGPGDLLDITRMFIILPDGIGHGRSSRPSDGLRARFPHYDYDDMVDAQHRLVTEGLGIDHLRLILGTSMGCMQAFVWGETYPDFAQALMPLACLPVPIAGRNRLWRGMVIDAIQSDPAWKGGDYVTEPVQGLRAALDILALASSAPIALQKQLPTRDAADRYLADYLNTSLPVFDANDLLYQASASRNYDPSARLGAIKVPVMWVNSADDFINPPFLGIAEREVKNLPNARFVLIPASKQTHGHGTHTWAALWKPYLDDLLRRSGH